MAEEQEQKVDFEPGDREAKIITTITTLVHLDELTARHAIDVQVVNAEIPVTLTIPACIGAARTALQRFQAERRRHNAANGFDDQGNPVVPEGEQS